MLKTRLDVTRDVGNELIALEQHIDGALITQGRLQTAVIEGRHRARLPLDAGQEAMSQVAAAAALLLEARRLVHSAHYGLRAVKDQMKIGPMSFGDYGDTPSNVFFEADDKVVAIADAA